MGRAAGTRAVTTGGLLELYRTRVRPCSSQVAPSCRACTTRVAWLVRGAMQARRPEATKDASVGARWPKPHWSLAAPVGAKFSPTSSSRSGPLLATSR